MRTSKLVGFSGMLILALCSSIASAHYLWVVIDDKEGDHGTTKIYFEHSAAAGDGHYLDHFTTGSQTWIRTTKQKEPQPISLKDTKSGEKRWLQAALEEPGPRSVDMHAKFGVYFYGKTPVLLHYYGRRLDVNSVKELNQLARSKQMDFDMVPQWEEGHLTLTVLWKGEPVVDQEVVIFGPNKFLQKPKTDDKGQVRFTAADPGQYRIRSLAEEHDPGTDDDGQKYNLIRHSGSLILDLPLEQ
jgi:uncharacterized GH25 family protein